MAVALPGAERASSGKIEATPASFARRYKLDLSLREVRSRMIAVTPRVRHERNTLGEIFCDQVGPTSTTQPPGLNAGLDARCPETPALTEDVATVAAPTIAIAA
jgi:hypothetical protein